MSDLSTDEQQILRLIETDPDQARYFFAKVKLLRWFDVLKELGYFEPERIINSVEDCNVFGYLERVSEQLGESPEYAKKLIKIIDDLVEFSSTQNKPDYRFIWWHCARITDNLPAMETREALPLGRFKLWLHTWIDCSKGAGLETSYIGSKLLPKFLEEGYGPDYGYANVIVQMMTIIRLEEGNVGEMPWQEDTRMAWGNYWIRQVVDEHGDIIGQKCSWDTLVEIAGQLRLVLQYSRIKISKDIETLDDEVYKVQVERIRNEACDLGFKENLYSCSISKYEKNESAEERHSNELKSFEFMASNKQEMIDEIGAALSDDMGWGESGKLNKTVSHIYDGLFSDHSRIWCRSLAGGDPHYDGTTKEILTAMLRKVLLSRCSSNIVEARKILELFLKPKYDFPIFKKLILLCVDEHWEDCHYIFERLLQLTPSILAKYDLEVELYDVLLHHNSKFNGDVKSKIKTFINDVPEFYKNEGLTHYWQFKWLSPLRDNEDFISLYKEAKSKAAPKDDADYVPERTVYEGGLIIHKSPISAEKNLEHACC